MSARTIQTLRTATRRVATPRLAVTPASSLPLLLCSSIRSSPSTSASRLLTATKWTRTCFSATSSRRSDFSRPAPPALPPHLQREFDELVRRAQTPAAPGVKLDSDTDTATVADKSRADPEQEMHPDLRRKPKPEFQGDLNPVTGEVGGPKIEPLKHGDWQYGGRATDF
ncbi:hypothetical protein JCM10908_002812 [Rhodotorula pacifica]|uniref:Sdh8p n=1 Tax=Rhodotorula pacifica TaxID=1495444 RepID=UPI00316E44FB